MKKQIHLFVLLKVLFLLIFVLGCNEEEFVELEPTVIDSDMPLSGFTANELPSLTKILGSTTNKNSVQWSSKKGNNTTVLNEDKILMVMDSIGNKTYSVRMFVPYTPYNVFYNVIAKETSEGVFNEPIILRYEIDKDYYDTYKSSNRKDAPFKGVIKMYGYGTFFDTGSISGRSVDNPCIAVNVNDDNNNSGGYSGGGNGGGGDEDGSYNTYGFGDTPSGWFDAPTPPPSSGTGGGGSDTGSVAFVEVGAVKLLAETSDPGWKRSTSSSKSGDCPEDELLVPINEEEDRIINELTGTPLCVYNKLNKTNGNLFKSTIGKFIDDPEYNLTFKIGNCPNTDNACTDANNVGNMSVIIEDTNLSELGLAATILHEGIHAEIFRYVSQRETGVDPNDRPRLLQLYAHYKGWANGRSDAEYKWKSIAHHVYMVENFVTPIAEAVQKLDGNRYTLDHYMAYGWEGLVKTGYDIKQLTTAENTAIQQLRSNVEASFNGTCK